MKYIGDIITDAREETDNSDYSATEGISQAKCLAYANKAQEMLQGTLMRNIQNCSLFDKTFTFSTVASQRAYGLPGDSTYAGTPTRAPYCFAGNSVRLVEYTDTGNSDDYCSLDPKDIHELDLVETTPPTAYTVQAKTILLSPVPNVASKTLRVTYPARLPKLDLRRGKIASYTTTAVTALNYLTITLNSGPTPDTILQDTNYYICVHDADGVLIRSNIKVASYDSVTRVLTMAADQTNDATLTTGSWITFGKFTTTHSELPEECERYLSQYLEWKLFKKDKSDEAKEAGKELTIVEDDLVKNFQSSNRDAQVLPVMDEFWLEV